MEILLHTLLFLTTLYVLVSPSNVPAIFTFGDSIFDAGNNHFIKNCTVQADFPPYGSSFFHHPTGRFTNGRTVVDFISQFIGINFQKPYLETKIAVMNGSRKSYSHNGINFASAGSGVLRGTNEESGVIPLQDQLQQFRASVEQNLIDKSLVQKSLFFFEAGSNDIFGYFVPADPPSLDPAYVQAMLVEVATFIEQIYKLGARRIVVFSLGPVGCIPARALLPGAPIDKCYGKMNLMVKEYNHGLERLVNHMHIKYPNAIVVYGSIYNIVQQIRAIPSHYGLSDVSNACCGKGTLGGLLQCGHDGYKICLNPNKFLFWDYFHPSEHAYKLISKALWGGPKSRIRPVNLKTLANITLI